MTHARANPRCSRCGWRPCQCYELTNWVYEIFGDGVEPATGGEVEEPSEPPTQPEQTAPVEPPRGAFARRQQRGT